MTLSKAYTNILRVRVERLNFPCAITSGLPAANDLPICLAVMLPNFGGIDAPMATID